MRPASQKVDHAVFYVACTESFNPSVSNGVQQVVVYVVGLQVAERLAVHSYGVLPTEVGEVGKLRCDINRLAWITFQSNTRRLFTPSLHIYG